MIRLNLSTDYALRSLLYLGNRGERQASVREVAEFYAISADHVSKVMQRLAHAGLVRAERGRTGGVRLGRPAAEITVGEVVELFEGPVALLECVNTEGVCVIQPGCRLRHVLEDAGARLIHELKQVSLADLVGRPLSSLVQLETVPPVEGSEPD